MKNIKAGEVYKLGYTAEWSLCVNSDTNKNKNKSSAG